MRFKEKMDNNWAPRKEKNWGKVKKIGYLGYKKKECSINKIGYFKMIPPKIIMTDRVY